AAHGARELHGQNIPDLRASLYCRPMRLVISPVVVAAICLLGWRVDSQTQTAPFDPTEKTIAELAAAMRTGATSSKRLVEAYLARIEAFDHQGPALNAIISINPKALDEADALDRERAA